MSENQIPSEELKKAYTEALAFRSDLATPQPHLDSTPIGMEIRIKQVYAALQDLQLYKNQKYGGSGIEPLGIFFKGGAEQGILARIDDKISRIKNTSEPSPNDVVDCIGYLMLYCIKKGWYDFSEFKD